MIAMPELRTALLDVLYETRDDDLKLIIGGGYGIKESPYYRSELKLAEFIEALRDLFPLAPIEGIS